MCRGVVFIGLGTEIILDLSEEVQHVLRRLTEVKFDFRENFGSVLPVPK